MIEHKGESIRFKQAPGKLLDSDPHFIVTSYDGTTALQLFADIEFQTRGYSLQESRSQSARADRSSFHALDLVLVYDKADQYPTHDQILLAAQCKSNQEFKKDFVREVLGLRFELSKEADLTESILSDLADQTSDPVRVPADPASEFWFAFVDPKGQKYMNSPGALGVQLKLFPGLAEDSD